MGNIRMKYKAPPHNGIGREGMYPASQSSGLKFTLFIAIGGAVVTLFFSSLGAPLQ